MTPAAHALGSLIVDYHSELIADGCRGIFGRLQLACSVPAIRESLYRMLPDADELLAAAFEDCDEDHIMYLADELDGLEVPDLGTLEWFEGDLFAVDYDDDYENENY